MVKAVPKIKDRKTRRRRKYQLKPVSKDSELKKPIITTVSPSSNHLHVLQISNSKPQESPTPTPNPLKKRSRCCSSSSSSTYGTCYSASPSPSPSSSSPALPLLLRRTVSGPPVLTSDSTSGNTNSKMMRKLLEELNASPSPSPPVYRNLMSQFLPPLPPSPSPKLLRRSVSDPVTVFPDSSTQKTATTSKGNNEKVKMQEQVVKTEKLSGDWTIIKLKCGCGSDLQFLFCGTDSKCYKLI